jgi:hypothetical protein
MQWSQERDWSKATMYGYGKPNAHFPGRIRLVERIPLPISGSQKPKEDPHYPAAVKRAREAARRLQEAGIIDAEGRRIREDLAADMREGQDRDLAG